MYVTRWDDSNGYEYFRALFDSEHVAFDTDNENSTLKLFHADAGFVELSKPASIDGLFSELNNQSLVVVAYVNNRLEEMRFQPSER